MMLARAPGSVLNAIDDTASDLAVWRESGVLRLAGWAGIHTTLFPEVKAALGYDGNPYDALYARLPGDVVEALGARPDTIDALLAKIRQMVNGVRNTGNQRSVPLDPEPPALTTWETQVEAQVDLPAILAQRGLSPRQIEVILLREVEELTQSEVAARLGLPRGTIKTHDERSRRKLGIE